jgi:hypothetical protein
LIVLICFSFPIVVHDGDVRESRTRLPPDELACALAADRFWRDETARLIGSHPDWPDAAFFLDIEEAIAHAFVLALSQLRSGERLGFARAFYAEHPAWNGRGFDDDPPSPLAIAASAALRVVDLAACAAVQDERIVDLLQGAAQGDDLTSSSSTAVDHLRRAVARVRFDPRLEDPADPHAVAALAVVEVLDPASEVVAVQEVLARAAFATVECRTRPETIDFLVAADLLL